MCIYIYIYNNFPTVVPQKYEHVSYIYMYVYIYIMYIYIYYVYIYRFLYVLYQFIHITVGTTHQNKVYIQIMAA